MTENQTLELSLDKTPDFNRQWETLERRKSKIKELIMETIDSLPDMVKMLIKMNLSSVLLLIDELSYEQTEMFLLKAHEILDELE